MITVDDLRRIYAEKLLATGSHDAAFTKAVWVAYSAGVSVAKLSPDVVGSTSCAAPQIDPTDSSRPTSPRSPGSTSPSGLS